MILTHFSNKQTDNHWSYYDLINIHEFLLVYDIVDIFAQFKIKLKMGKSNLEATPLSILVSFMRYQEWIRTQLNKDQLGSSYYVINGNYNNFYPE